MLTAAELRAVKPDSRDRLSQWAVEYLAGAKDRSLPAMPGPEYRIESDASEKE